MHRAWIFQANPQLYDIDTALTKLDVIHWKVPQHAGEMRPGDKAVIWRSGSDAGIVAIGVVLERPRVMSALPEEERYWTGGEGDVRGETRVPIRLTAVDFVGKARVKELPSLARHQIVVAPMGTVFPLDPIQEGELERLLPEFPKLPLPAGAPLVPPKPFAWAQRRKSASPLPGGSTQYLVTLAGILRQTQEGGALRTDLERWMNDEHGVSKRYAELAVDFLIRASILEARGTRIEPSAEALHWLETRDDAYLVSLLHARIRFIGEMLQVLQEPHTTDEVLDVANSTYGMGWTTSAQVNRRFGWLQSARTIELDEHGRLVITAFGREVLPSLELYEPAATVPTPVETHEPAPETVEVALVEPRRRTDVAQAIADRLERASHRSDTPGELEEATADAFSFLGFGASWLGGAGRTDVLLSADLGSGESYVVVVDCKSTGKDAVQDQQIDWVTIQDHRRIHRADHAAIVGPSFHGRRLEERAEVHDVSLISVETLSTICRQHAIAPLDLLAYRALFTVASRAGEHDAASEVTEKSEEIRRQMAIAASIVKLVHTLQGQEGAISEEALYWNLRGFSDEFDPPSREEIQAVVGALAAPPFGALRSTDGGFRSPGDLRTAAERLRLIADQIDPVAVPPP